MNSCLYECSVFHRRLSPARHEFLYGVFMFAIDLDELEAIHKKIPFLGINAPGLYSFQEKDHFQIREGPARANAVAFLEQNGIVERPARILLLTNLRVLGYTFNPISIWFCFREDGSPLAAIAEVGNTFRELKPFLVPWRDGQFHLRAPKNFYVSPFSDVDLEFDFRFEVPGNRLAVWIDDYRGSERVLVSTLTGKRVELTASNLLSLTAKYPLMTLRVIFLIHWQAFKLWRKKIPFFQKEDRLDRQTDVFNRREDRK